MRLLPNKEPICLISDIANVVDEDFELRNIYNKECGYNSLAIGLLVKQQDFPVFLDDHIEFLYESFSNNCISKRYHNFIILKVDGLKQIPYVIDWITGRKLSVDSSDDYEQSGLFYSFNCAFYKKSNESEWRCYDIYNGERFLLKERIDSTINVKEWSICPVPDCILIMTIEPKDNLVLYNVRKREVVQTATFPVKEDKRYSFGMYFDKEKQRVIVKSFCPTEPLDSDVQCYSVYFDDFLK
ncbi:MAG: hypothetical protein MJ010_00450 [Paludibacteraceae bacterium]|nr:hypothetical protein [Paludibacteraceae bacterium]